MVYPITPDIIDLFEAEQRKVLSITGTDKNGAAITITDDNVIADSFQIDRYCCNGEKLEIVTAIAAQLMFTLENGDGTYDAIDFEGAELNVRVGIADWTRANPRVSWVSCGYFTPDEQPMRMSTISITALDRMTKFDVVVDAADLTFPTTVAGLVGQVCSACGVTLAQSITGLPNASVSIAELPTVQDTLTYRTLIQWCAGIMATNAWFDWNGQLRFTWYSNYIGRYASTVDNRYSSNIYGNDLIVSGVEYTTTGGVPIVEGTDDYDLDITGNALAGPLIATVLPVINAEVNGFIYRPFTASAVNAPYLWPMDEVELRDKDNGLHFSTLTNVTFGLNGTTALEARGMTYVTNKAKYPKGFTREQAQLVNQAMEHVEQDIDESLTQQEIFNRLTDNGAAQGLVLYNGQLYVNASYIQSGTLVLGGLNNQNGTLKVLNAAGQEIGTWTKDGISIQRGDINLDSTGSIKVGFNAADTKYVQFNVNGMQLVLDSGSVIKTGSIGFTNMPHYPNNTTFGALNADVEDGSEKWESEFVPGYFWVGHRNGGISDYSLAYNLGLFRVVGPDGEFQIDTDNDLIYTTYGMSVIGNAVFSSVRADSLDLFYSLPITSGGTGANTAAVNITTQYHDIEEAINDVRESRAFPISLQKTGDSYYSDMPTGYETAEWNMELVGNGGRLTAFLFLYGQTFVYRRDFYNGSWWTGWTKIAPITPADIGAVNKAGDTMTGRLTIDISAQGDQGRIIFTSPGVSGQCHLVANTTGTQQRITFRQYVPNGTSFEEYALPNTADYTGAPVLRNILTDKSPVTIPQGGTGTTTAAGAISKLFDIYANDARNYPNAPGVYRTVGTNIFSNLQPGSLYGVLIIIGRVYAAHFYIDAYSNMFVGFSSDVFGEPTTWKKCTP